MGKVLVILGTLVLLALPCRADSFQVNESTFSAALEGFPATDYVDWVIQGQLTGPDATNDFYFDIPVIYNLFGIDPAAAGMGVSSIHSVCEFGSGTVSNIDFCNQQLTYATSTIPLGTSFSSSFDLPTPVPTPEPSTWLLAGTGLLAIMLIMRKQAKA